MPIAALSFSTLFEHLDPARLRLHDACLGCKSGLVPSPRSPWTVRHHTSRRGLLTGVSRPAADEASVHRALRKAEVHPVSRLREVISVLASKCFFPFSVVKEVRFVPAHHCLRCNVCPACSWSYESLHFVLCCAASLPGRLWLT